MPITLTELAKRLPSRLDAWVPHIIAAELMFGVDPFWLAAIIDQESNGGDALTPKGPKGTGDHGHGRGLGQIDDRSHRPFIDAKLSNGLPLWQHPAFNIAYAAWLLRENLDALGGDYFAAVAAYNCGAARARRVVAALSADASTELRIKALDAVTFKSSYLARVVERRNTFLSSATA